MPETPDERREIEDLLPFYLNGSLADADRLRVERALDDDEGLRTELDFLVRWRQTVKDTAQDQGVGALGERRLLRSIRDEGVERETPSRDATVSPLRRFVRPALALAAGLALVVQAATIWNLQSELDARGELQTLSGGAVFKVQLADDATVGDVSAFLLDEGLVIVEGPTALGFYELTPIDEELPDDALRSLLERIRENDALFSYAERAP